MNPASSNTDGPDGTSDPSSPLVQHSTDTHVRTSRYRATCTAMCKIHDVGLHIWSHILYVCVRVQNSCSLMSVPNDLRSSSDPLVSTKSESGVR